MNRKDFILILTQQFPWDDFIDEMKKIGFVNQKFDNKLLKSNDGTLTNSGYNMLVENYIEGGAIKDTSLLHINPKILFRPLNEDQLALIVKLSKKFKISSTTSAAVGGMVNKPIILIK